MALNNSSLGLGFSIGVDDRASGPIKKIQTGIQSLQGSAEKTSQSLRSGLGIAGSMVLRGFARRMREASVGMIGLAMNGADFEQQVAAVGSIAKATSSQLKELREAAIEAGLATKFSPDESIAGLKVLITSGLSAQRSMEALTPALRLATAAEISVSDAAKSISSSLNSFDADGLKTTEIMDKLTATLQQTNFQGADFAAGLANVAGQAGLYNQTLDTTLIGLGMLRSRNIGASKAATGMREAIRRIASDQTAMNLVTERGISIYDESGTKMRNIIDIMFELKEAFKGTGGDESNPIMKKIFGSRGLNAFGAITTGTIEREIDGQMVKLKGKEAVEFLRKELEGSAGITENFEKALLGTFAGQMQLINGIIETFKVEFGTTLSDVLKPLVVWFKDFSKAAVSAFKNMSPGMKKFLGMLVIGGSILLGVGGALLGIVATIAILEFALASLGVTLAGVMSIMGTFLVVAASVAAGAYLIYKAYDTNFGGLKDIFTDIGTLANGLYTIFSTNGELTPELSDGKNTGIRKFVINVFAMVERIKKMISGIGDKFEETWNRSKAKMDEMKKYFQDFGDKLNKGIVKPLDEFFDKFSGSDIENFYTFGRFLGGVFLVGLAGAVTYISAMVKVFTNLILLLVDIKNLFFSLGKVASGVAGIVYYSFKQVFYQIKHLFFETVVMLGSLMGKLPKSMRPGWVDDFVEYASTEGVAGAAANARKRDKAEMRVNSEASYVKAKGMDALGAGGDALMHAGTAALHASTAPLQALFAQMKTSVDMIKDRPIEVNVKADVKVDGERLMSTVENQSRSSQARTFSVDPALGD